MPSRPWLPLCALLALGCASNPPPTDAGTDTPAPLDGGTDVTPPEDRPAALDVVAVDRPDVNVGSDPVPLGDVVDVVDAGGEDAPDAVAVADVPAMDAPDVVTADTPDVAVAVVDVADAGPLCDAMLDSDYTNCGACGVVCGDRPNAVGVCRAGACTTACRSNFADCDGDPSNGCETSIINNASNCGMCGRACGTGQQCAFTTCRCPVGWEFCGTRCTLLQSDFNNCGACGVVCRSPNGTPTCTAGRCNVTCPTSDRRADCDDDPSNGCETDLRTSPDHCGGCRMACSSAGAVQACVNSACTPTCNSGFANCDGVGNNGCEVDIANSPTNCGSCGYSCARPFDAPTWASFVCRSGACVIVSCDSGWLDCDMRPQNGCETPHGNNNCGSCGRRCPAGTTCINAVCR